MPRKHGKPQRPLALNLILAYVIAVAILDIFAAFELGSVAASATAGVLVGVAINLIAAYLGLVRMKRIWTYVLVVLLLFGVVGSILISLSYEVFTIEEGVLLAANVLASAWLLKNRKLFN